MVIQRVHRKSSFSDTMMSGECCLVVMLQLMSKGHRSGKVGTHQCCHGGTWYVMLEEEEMSQKLGMTKMFRLLETRDV